MSRSREEEKKQRQLLGKAICGFANAKTTDEACFAILAGIQRNWRFSSGFIEEIKKIFPTMRNVTPPPKQYNEEDSEIFSKEKKVLSRLLKKLGPPFELSCNRYRQVIWISLSPTQLEDLDKFPEWKQAVVHRALMRKGNMRFRMADFSPMKNYESHLVSWIDHIEKIDLQDNEAIYEDYEDMHKAIVAMTSGHESDFDSIKNLEFDLQKSWIRHNTIVLHKTIQDDQKIVRMILDALIHNKPIRCDLSTTDQKPGYALSKYLEVYNRMPKYILEFNQRDRLKERYQICKEDYLAINLPMEWLERIIDDLAYCLIEFLRPGDNRKYIGMCMYCKGYFTAKGLYNQKFCSTACQQEAYHSKPEVKERKAAAQREKHGWKKSVNAK